MADKLMDLKTLLDSGVITEDEYKTLAKKAESINHASCISKQNDDLTRLLETDVISKEEYELLLDRQTSSKSMKSTYNSIGYIESKVPAEIPLGDASSRQASGSTISKLILGTVIGILIIFIFITSSGSNEKYISALEDVYDYAGYVVDGDDKYYHHAWCNSFDNEITFEVFNKENAEAKGYHKCPDCWNMDMESFVSEFYYGSYKDAAIEYFEDCAFITDEKATYYHRANCDKILESDGYYIFDTEWLENKGFCKCPDCWGDSNAVAKTYIDQNY